MPDSMTQRQRYNEIDPVELCQSLWKRKYLIVGVTLAVSIIAALYAFLSAPVYRVQVATVSPSLSEIAGFNIARGLGDGSTSLKPFSSSDVYAVFTRNLVSDRSKRQFYRQTYLPSLGKGADTGSQDELYADFLQRVYITVPTATQPDRFVLNIEGKDPGVAVQLAQQYIDQVEQRSLQEMLDNAQSEIALRNRGIQRQIAAQRESARVRREDRVIQLNEALKVAQAIGLENPPMIAGQMNDQLSAIMEGSLTYMRGTKALTAEIEALNRRASDDPFIPGLRNLQEQYALYATVEIDPKSVKVFSLDGVVETPDEPIKPKKVLILALGVVFGLTLGVFIAVITVMRTNRRD